MRLETPTPMLVLHPCQALEALQVAMRRIALRTNGPGACFGGLASRGVPRWHGVCVATGTESRTLLPAMPIDDLRPQDWRPDFMRSNPAFPAWMARERWNLAPQLASVRAPALLLWGDADAISPVAVGERLQGLLPRARLQVLPGGAHDLAQTHAEAVAGHISHHLRAGTETA